MDKIQIPNEPFKKSHKPVNEMVKRGEVDEKEIAELNSIPGFKENVWKRYNALKKKGVLNGKK